MCSGGYWGTVCGIGATNATADVVCRELNFAGGGMCVQWNIQWKCNQWSTFAGVIYLQSNLTVIYRVVPIARTNIVCNGNEDTLSECRYSGGDGNPACDHSYDIIVRCVGKIY